MHKNILKSIKLDKSDPIYQIYDLIKNLIPFQ